MKVINLSTRRPTSHNRLPTLKDTHVNLCHLNPDGVTLCHGADHPDVKPMFSITIVLIDEEELYEIIRITTDGPNYWYVIATPERELKTWSHTTFQIVDTPVTDDHKALTDMILQRYFTATQGPTNPN